MNGKKNFAKFMEKKMFHAVPKEKMNDDFRNMRKEENMSNVVNTSERRILFYKTKICPWYIKGKCERRKTCLYAHAQNELRELPNLCKTSLCPKLKINESCNDKKCKYAHTNIELRATENLYKTALCESFLKGKCFSGQFCRYAHGQNELREHPMEITDKNIIIGTNKMKNDKLDYEKKKNGHGMSNSMHSGENGKRNETYCVMPKKKETTHPNKVSALTEDDGVGEVTEAIDPHALNGSTTDNSYDCSKKGGTENAVKSGNTNGSGNGIQHGGNHGPNHNSNHGGNKIGRKNDAHEYHKKGHKSHKYKNAEIMNNNSSSRCDGRNRNATPSSVGNYLKNEDCTNFNEEQFLNDNLNVLGFLEEHNSGIEKYGKGSNIDSSALNDVGSNSLGNFGNNNMIGGSKSNSGALMKYTRNNEGIRKNSNSSSLMNFNMASTNAENLDMSMDMPNNGSEDNYYNFTGTNLDKLNYEDLFFSTNTMNNSVNAMNTLNSMGSMGSISSFNSMNTNNGNSGGNMNCVSGLNGLGMNSMSNMAMDMSGMKGMVNLNNMSNMNVDELNDLPLDMNNLNDLPLNMDNMNDINLKMNMGGMNNAGEMSTSGVHMNNGGDCNSRTQRMLRKYLMLDKEQNNNGTARPNFSGNNRNIMSGNNMMDVGVNCEQQANLASKMMKEKENPDNHVSWENFSLFGKAKSFGAEKDYFKIFNYGMCNNYDKKLFENYDVHKREMDKVDKSLFIL
ncbi:zinc finger protein, putative [Plasmodium knowlesi strain H]|uniref:Zinc finger protein, putative n=3 Tax=Plasmodium knowlesi TaxID=5850 RepID=A0A5K1U203_PLAKH|nr:zinc finger protein, putative [Plasmodium knowlesi strain H]OTN67362.1 putative Zinc finger protein [Plasmodium knowlesi]CAA9987334.1 zinc finger protein, putative [Plasmodium knowlesi strain H]SBO23384.1 zinc finger protein, putative [Plasmodium knowlesi strain H]SBO24609.1 zinc finger protein, putative [Plasmodium knowlesi strain H]VVS76808.1 zinc finger protein, putative [Plasmodium knowlesi strain H]|eukprot:XP_002258338.1 hypothetical protein, conserved in Plasmodium species [Plasmodium knowlesi strain H]